MFYSNNFVKGRKNLSYCFRLIKQAEQLAKHGKIEKTSSGNELAKEITSDSSEEWSHFEKKYSHLRKQTLEKFVSFAPHKDVEKMEKKNGLVCISYIFQKSVRELERDFSILVTKKSIGGEKCLHISASEDSDVKYELVRECHDLVLKEDGLEIVSMGPNIFYDKNNKDFNQVIDQVDVIERRKPFKCFQLFEGILVVLYFKKGWNFTSPSTIYDSCRNGTFENESLQEKINSLWKEKVCFLQKKIFIELKQKQELKFPQDEQYCFYFYLAIDGRIIKNEEGVNENFFCFGKRSLGVLEEEIVSAEECERYGWKRLPSHDDYQSFLQKMQNSEFCKFKGILVWDERNMKQVLLSSDIVCARKLLTLKRDTLHQRKSTMFFLIIQQYKFNNEPEKLVCNTPDFFAGNKELEELYLLCFQNYKTIIVEFKQLILQCEPWISQRNYNKISEILKEKRKELSSLIFNISRQNPPPTIQFHLSTLRESEIVWMVLQSNK